MSIAEELYTEGARRYKSHDYAGSERAFRQLLQVVPPQDGAGYGRAAYSLALALIGQQRTVEARNLLADALRADPGLDRARDRLAELDQHTARPPAATTPGGIIGTAQHIQQRSEPDPWFGQQKGMVLTFRLVRVAPDGRPLSPLAIEIRGNQIEGSLMAGDVVEVPGPWRPGDRSSYVLNHTTGEVVAATRSGTRVLQWIILGTFLVAFLVFFVFVGSNLMSSRP